MKQRNKLGEKIGGGYIVLRRNAHTGRFNPNPHKPAFEFPSEEAARGQADKLAKKYPGATFSILQEIGCARSDNAEGAE